MLKLAGQHIFNLYSATSHSNYDRLIHYYEPEGFNFIFEVPLVCDHNGLGIILTNKKQSFKLKLC